VTSVSSKPRPAATVVVIRQGEHKPEVFMARRHSKAVFASHYVFPGGILEAADMQVHGLAGGVSQSDANDLLGLTEGALDYYSAAIREAFEESSVLLAKKKDGSWAFCDGGREQQQIQTSRDHLNAGKLSWTDFLQSNDFRPAYDSLHYISYWVTPRGNSKRFSTRFFLAVIPDGQTAVHDDGELIDSCWMTASDVLAAGERGQMKLMLPTTSTLEEIAIYDTVDAVVDWARQQGRSGVAKILPAFVNVDGKDQVVLPGSHHYPLDFDT
jgi:8-oxo-dGTP pyrophosphatase MutT (NUDIX family)